MEGGRCSTKIRRESRLSRNVRDGNEQPEIRSDHAPLGSYLGAEQYCGPEVAPIDLVQPAASDKGL